MRRALGILLLFAGVAASDEQALVEGLQSPDDATRGRAQQQLLALPPASRVSALRAVLRNVDSEGYVSMACHQLGLLGPAAIPAVPELIETLYAPSPYRRTAAIDALGAMGGSAWRVRGLLVELREEGSVLRASANRALAAIGVPDRPQPDPLANEPWRLEGQRLGAGAATVAELRAALEHDHAYVRHHAGRALALRGADGIAVLADVLRKSTGSLRLRVLTALASSRDPRAIPPLLEVLRNDEGRPLEIAIEALGAFEAPEAEAGILELLRDADLARAKVAIPALERIRPGASGPVLRSWLDSPDKSRVGLAFRMLPSAPTCAKEFLPELIQALYTPRRNSAAGLFAKLGPHAAEAGPFLIDRRTGKHDYYLEQAIRATGAEAPLVDPLPESASTEELLTALRGEDWLSAGMAGRRLGDAEWSAAIGEALARALHHSKPFVVDAAFQAIGKHGAEAVPLLAEALANGSLEIQLRSLALLTEMGDPSAGAADAVVAALDVPELKWPSIEWIKLVGPPAAAAAPKLIRWYREAEEPGGYGWALGAIGEAGKEIIPDLIRDVEDERRGWFAIVALREFGPLAASAAPTLGRLILRRHEEVPNPRAGHVVLQAIDALARMGDPGADEIRALLESGNDQLARLVTEAYRYAGRETYALRRAYWELRDSESGVVRNAALGYLGRPAVLKRLDDEQLRVLMATKAPRFRGETVAAELVLRADMAEVIRALESDDAVLRKAALATLKVRKQEAKEAVPALGRQLVKEPITSVQRTIVYVLCEIAGKEAQPYLVEYVRNHKRHDAWQSAYVRLKSWADLEFLGGLLVDDEARVRFLAERTLSELGAKFQPDLREALTANLLDGKRRSKYVASLLKSWGADGAPAFVQLHRSLTYADYDFARRYLEGMGAAALPALLEALEDMHPSVRARTVYLVEKCGEAGDEHLLRVLEKDEDSDVRTAVVKALTNRGAKVAPILVPTLGDAHVYVRRAAWSYCQKHAETSPLAVPILIRSLGVKELRKETLARLKEVGEAALPALREAAKAGRSPWAVLMLAELGEVEEKTLRPILAGDDRDALVQAVRLLAPLGPEAEASVRDLLALLGSEDRSLVVEAVRTLGCLGAAGRPAVDRLLSLRSNSSSLRDAVAVAVTRIQHPPAVLVDLLNVGQSGLSREVWRALAQSRLAALPELMALAGNQDHGRKAIELIGQLGPAAMEAVPLLEKLRKDPNLGRYAEAALALIRPK